MKTFFVIVNATSKLAENFPDTSGLTTEAQTLQWIDDMVNNGGMGPNQELVASYEPEARSTVSDALFIVSEERTYNSETHPIYTMLKQYRITYPLIETTLDYRLEAIDNKESEANESTMPSQKRLRNLILAFDNALKALGYDKNTTLINNKKKEEIKLVQDIADKIRANKATKDDKVAKANANLPFDIKSDWLYDNYDENVTL